MIAIIRKIVHCFVFSVLLNISTVSLVFGQIEHLEKSFVLDPTEAYRIEVRIDAGRVRFSKSSKDLTVSMRYDKDEFRSDVDFDEAERHVYIELDKRSFIGNNDDTDAKVEIGLPSDVRISLEGEFKAVEVNLELGGLSLDEVELTTLAGEVLIEFSKPNKIEMAYLRINTKIGETQIRKLGNARFQKADINGGIGEMRVDFDGRLLPKSFAEIDLDIGETRLYLPEHVGIKLALSKFMFLSDIDLPHDFEKSGKYYYSSNYQDADNTLNLRISTGIGALQIN